MKRRSAAVLGTCAMNNIDRSKFCVYPAAMCRKHRRSGLLIWYSQVLLLSLVQLAFPAEHSTALQPWNDYRTIMWIGDSAYHHPEKLPLFFQRLREMGINTAMVYGDGDPQPLVEAHFPYYVENLVNRGLCLKFNSRVRDWDKTVTDWARNGRPESSLVRDYCLDDKAWLGSARETLERIVTKNAPHHPVAYNIRDELSTTISANPFDYDFNPIALEQLRAWLKTQYADLAALNLEWQTQFPSWDAVKPFTTDQIKNRMATGDAIPRGQPDWQRVQQAKFMLTSAKENPTAWNFSPWTDFRTYMDLSLARALEKLREAAHALDPGTPVGIEGTQMPDAFGGYDLWCLSQALDWVEPYDIGCAREIFGSFMPGKPILTTVFESETRAAQRRLWHLLLEGDRGCLVWWSEDCIDWQAHDWPLTRKAKALAPVLREMTSPLAELFLRSERERDPLFIHYSQPSIQVDWLLESTVDGSTWLRRFSSFEAENNQMAKTRAAWLKALQDLGYSPQFLSSRQIEMGALERAGNAVLILPESLAISDKECAELQKSFENAETKDHTFQILSEGPAGCFDGHGKFRQGLLGGTLRTLATNAGSIAITSGRAISQTDSSSRGYLEDRLKARATSAWLDWLRDHLAANRLDISLESNTHARAHRFLIKAGRLVAFERNINYQMSEGLKQAGGNEALERPLVTEAILREPAHVYDLRAEQYLGFTDHIRFTLDPWRPALFALLRKPMSEKSIVTELEKDLKP
jgi:hypothetical protein